MSRRLRIALVALVATIVYFSDFILMALPQPDPSVVSCPDGYAFRLPADDANAGRYIACESFDAYFEADARGADEVARALLVK